MRKPTQEEIDKCVARMQQLDLQGSDLDDAVHTAKGEEAAEINNSGVEEQIRYLLEGNGPDGVEALLEEIAEEN